MRLVGTLLIILSATIACNDDLAESSSGAGSGGAGGQGAGGAVTPAEPTLPVGSGACPDLADGDVIFSPAGVTPRRVRIFMDPDATAAGDGPLVFYWHGTGSSPNAEPPYGLGEAMTWVLENGGIVAAPHSDPTSGQWPWFLTAGGDDESDLLLADEVLACAVEKVGIDTSRIHSIGMSAGGLNTTQMSYRRSGYLASVVTYSGGILGTEIPVQAEDNLFPAMIFHGGVNDTVIVNFKDLSEAYLNDLRGRGHFAFICDHGQQHTIPTTDNEQASVKRFLEDHPWGTSPSPYAEALPDGFPAYCAL